MGMYSAHHMHIIREKRKQLSLVDPEKAFSEEVREAQKTWNHFIKTKTKRRFWSWN